ncbi:uncharacterized protein BDR25DRAFT_359842 [Lindgomyces ingoldianus]|uniref:Uncharacterized protein n=1 Tax=Lindgomyces ingoldianus TaxID=673940 RepID=A0ACB6QGF5_9PLEO|nr:uncharacterized protein BDR25DRAFT_359842 [Lindgomyces ingoldianus]KAF2466053.1 hypothetical protein BDR25DRAFT_359842 [Lindgomyces ingoldianus]
MYYSNTPKIKFLTIYGIIKSVISEIPVLGGPHFVYTLVRFDVVGGHDGVERLKLAPRLSRLSSLSESNSFVASPLIWVLLICYLAAVFLDQLDEAKALLVLLAVRCVARVSRDTIPMYYVIHSSGLAPFSSLDLTIHLFNSPSLDLNTFSCKSYEPGVALLTSTIGPCEVQHILITAYSPAKPDRLNDDLLVDIAPTLLVRPPHRHIDERFDDAHNDFYNRAKMASTSDTSVKLVNKSDWQLWYRRQCHP